MSKWTIEYGMCDGTGPYYAEAEGVTINAAIAGFRADHPAVDPCNINVVTKKADEKFQNNLDTQIESE